MKGNRLASLGDFLTKNTLCCFKAVILPARLADITDNSSSISLPRFSIADRHQPGSFTIKPESASSKISHGLLLP